MAGYVGKKDKMRSNAEAVFKKQGGMKSKKSCKYDMGGEVGGAPFAPPVQKDILKVQPTAQIAAKKGGCIKKAAGGVAKIRHKEATKSGAPLNQRMLRRTK
jgi:hypothetical protein